MNISQVFSTKERILILQRALFSNKPLSVNCVAKELSLSKGLVSKYFDILVKEKILKKINNKFFVLDNLFVRSIKIFLNINNIDLRIFKKFKFIKSVGLYGSCAKGVNDENSDIDIWIKTEKLEDKELARLNNELNKKFRNIKVLFLNEEKINNIKKTDPLFYHSLFFGSIILYGENEI